MSKPVESTPLILRSYPQPKITELDTVNNKVTSVLKRALTSPTFWAVASAALTVSGVVASCILFAHLGPALLPIALLTASIFFARIPCSICSKFSDRIFHDISLLWNRMKIEDIVHSGEEKPNKQKWLWCNEIPIPGTKSGEKGALYLGSLPLRGTTHAETFKNIGVKTVISAVESFEFGESIVASPITKKDYSTLGIENVHISTPDYQPLTEEALMKGAQAIHEQRKKGSVFVHCKAGRGRSAMAVAAYFIVFQGMKAEEAVAHVKTYRPNASLKIGSRSPTSTESKLTKRQQKKFQSLMNLERLYTGKK